MRPLFILFLSIWSKLFALDILYVHTLLDEDGGIRISVCEDWKDCKAPSIGHITSPHTSVCSHRNSVEIFNSWFKRKRASVQTCVRTMCSHSQVTSCWCRAMFVSRGWSLSSSNMKCDKQDDIQLVVCHWHLKFSTTKHRNMIYM